MATDPTDIKHNEDDDDNVSPIVDETGPEAASPLDDSDTTFINKADTLLIGGWYRTVEGDTRNDIPTDEPDEYEKRIRTWLRRRIGGAE